MIDRGLGQDASPYDRIISDTLLSLSRVQDALLVLQIGAAADTLLLLRSLLVEFAGRRAAVAKGAICMLRMDFMQLCIYHV